MPKIRKKKTPITTTALVVSSATSSSKPESSRTVIRRFHVLLKQQTQLQKVKNDPLKKQQLVNVEHEIERLGGLESYQRMSAIGQGKDRGGGSEQVLIQWLKDASMHKAGTRLKLLEVGALKPDNYDACSLWIAATPIDLNSRHPLIKEQDFLLLDEVQNHAQWDIISLSLVLNFVPEPSHRGRMLRLAHSFLTTSGHLFVALPLPCLLNSRYLNFELFNDLMVFLGFTELRRKWKQGGKMVYYLFQKAGTLSPVVENEESDVPEQFRKKTVIRQGNRNNFSILI